MTDRRALDLDHELSRRKFLAGLGLVGTVVAGSYAVDTWARPLAAGAATQRRRSSRGRSVTPWSSSSSRAATTASARSSRTPIRTIAGCGPRWRSTTRIDLDGSVGLHPSLAKLADRYRAGQVAIVEGIGYPKQRSLALRVARELVVGAARSRRAPRAGSVATSTRRSDSRRSARRSGDRARTVARVGRRAVVRNEHQRRLAVSNPTRRRGSRDPDTLPETWAKFAPATRRPLDAARPGAGGGRPHQRRARRARARPLGALRRPVTTTPPTAAAYADGTPVANLELAAQLVAAKQPPKVIYVTNIGDYDTHQGQAARQQALHARSRRRTRTLLHVGRGRGRRRQRDRRDPVGVRPACTGERQRHRPRRRERPLRHRLAVKGGRYGEPTSLAHSIRAATSRWRSTSARCTRPRSEAGSASTPNRSSAPDSRRRPSSSDRLF